MLLEMLFHSVHIEVHFLHGELSIPLPGAEYGQASSACQQQHTASPALCCPLPLGQHAANFTQSLSTFYMSCL